MKYHQLSAQYRRSQQKEKISTYLAKAKKVEENLQKFHEQREMARRLKAEKLRLVKMDQERESLKKKRIHVRI